MKHDLGVKTFLYPMPALTIATYNDDHSVDVMVMAWGGICDYDKVALNLDETHKTVANIKKRRAFTISVPDAAHLAEIDFLGTVSANSVPDKFARTGLHATPSAKVDAPVVDEFPITLECEVIEEGIITGGYRVVGKIVGTLADEKILDTNGKVDPAKINAFAFDPFQNAYYALGQKIGQAFSDGKRFMPNDVTAK